MEEPKEEDEAKEDEPKDEEPKTDEPLTADKKEDNVSGEGDGKEEESSPDNVAETAEADAPTVVEEKKEENAKEESGGPDEAAGEKKVDSPSDEEEGEAAQESALQVGDTSVEEMERKMEAALNETLNGEPSILDNGPTSRTETGKGKSEDELFDNLWDEIEAEEKAIFGNEFGEKDASTTEQKETDNAEQKDATEPTPVPDKTTDVSKTTNKAEEAKTATEPEAKPEPAKPKKKVKKKVTVSPVEPTKKNKKKEPKATVRSPARKVAPVVREVTRTSSYRMSRARSPLVTPTASSAAKVWTPPRKSNEKYVSQVNPMTAPLPRVAELGRSRTPGRSRRARSRTPGRARSSSTPGRDRRPTTTTTTDTSTKTTKRGFLFETPQTTRKVDHFVEVSRKSPPEPEGGKKTAATRTLSPRKARLLYRDVEASKLPAGAPMCTRTWVLYLHPARGGCDRCLYFATPEERKKFDTDGHHYRINLVTGGCSRGCALFPRSENEPPVRLCRKCFYDTHARAIPDTPTTQPTP